MELPKVVGFNVGIFFSGFIIMDFFPKSPNLKINKFKDQNDPSQKQSSIFFFFFFDVWDFCNFSLFLDLILRYF